jgi:hypothetical protein
MSLSIKKTPLANISSTADIFYNFITV